MNNYTLCRTPATVTAAATMLLFGQAAIALAQLDAMDRVADGGGKMATIRSGDMMDIRLSPTLRANLHEAPRADVGQLLDAASAEFAAKLSQGAEALGAEFAAVIEEDFWDLVLR